MDNSTTPSSAASTVSHAFYWSLVVIGAATFALNAVFSWMFIEFRKVLLVHNNNKILLSMTLADGLVGLSSILLGALLMLQQPQIIYKLFGMFPLFGSMFASIASLGILTIDRLVVVKFPLRYKTLIFPSRIHKMIVVSWVVPFLITLQESIVYMYTSWKFELKLRGIMLFVIFASGSIILLIANTKLCLIIRRHTLFLKRHSNLAYDCEVSVTDEPSSGAKSDAKRLRMMARSAFARTFRKEIKAAKMCIIITFLFVFCWVPLTSYRFSYSLGYPIIITWLRRICLLMAALNSFLNPLVYLMTRDGFRSYIWDTTLMKFIRRRSGIA